MNDLSRLADMAEILGALVVIGGLIFAVLQMRHFRQQRREMAAIELFRFFGNADFNRAYEFVVKLPDGLSNAELEARHPGGVRVVSVARRKARGVYGPAAITGLRRIQIVEADAADERDLGTPPCPNRC